METIITRRQTTPPSPFTGSDLHPVLQRIYGTRGLQTAPELELKHLLPYSTLKNIDQAVERLYLALAKQQKILIIGDYDTDGATSTALAVSVLKAFGAKAVDYLVPNRFQFGYGLTPGIVELAQTLKPDLLVTVDNGIASVDGVATANSLGIDVIVTDHHLAPEQLPQATAIVNPNQLGCEFPSKAIAGVGVIFYVMLALRRMLLNANWFSQHNIPEPKMSDWLDLVALGTVADVVPLDQNNRILVKQGLKRIRAGYCRPGITALLAVGNRSRERAVASDMGFAVAPRLNAAGRLDDMSLGIECLLSNDLSEALQIATQLDTLNLERRKIEAGMQEQALRAIDKLHFDPTKEIPKGLCLFDKDWHQGVIGIVAGRIKDRLNRPVIAFAPVSDEEIKGSARSIKGVHIRDVLDDIATRNPGLITKFGGHAMAAGLSLHPDKLSQFATEFANAVAIILEGKSLTGEILSDGELTPAELNFDFAQTLRYAGPWGQHFPEPIFDGCFQLLEQFIIGEKHLKLRVSPVGVKQRLEAIQFNVDVSLWPNHRVDRVKLAYRLDINEYQQNLKLQLIIEHLEIMP